MNSMPIYPGSYLWSAFVDTSIRAMTAHWREVLPKVTPRKNPKNFQISIINISPVHDQSF